MTRSLLNTTREYVNETKMTKGIPRPKQPEKQSAMLLSQQDKRRLVEGATTTLTFSFRFFEGKHETFCCDTIKSEWFIRFLDSLQEISRLIWAEVHSRRNHFRVHKHDWSRLKHRFALPNAIFEQIEEDCYQWSLSKGKGRVHGFLISDVFYVVWLDPNHQLYPRG